MPDEAQRANRAACIAAAVTSVLGVVVLVAYLVVGDGTNECEVAVQTGDRAVAAFGLLVAYNASEKKTVATVIAMTGALLVALVTVFSAQVLSDAGFGKGGEVLAYGALAVAAFTAGTGVTAVASSINK